MENGNNTDSINTHTRSPEVNRPDNLNSVISFLAIDATFSIYFGWTTVASIVNITCALIGSGVYGAPHPDQYAIVIISIATAVFLVVVLRPSTGNWAYGFVFTWAAIAISKGDQCGGLVKKSDHEFFGVVNASPGSAITDDEQVCTRVQNTALWCAILVAVMSGCRLIWWIWQVHLQLSRK